ncbi:TlpA family protein disulfide reductase [Crassaminicella indica]|uniref:TlpA family protein disulfide reductase n=1 Tax=Crassaminicella indica TaxID=2855394 RepID=A0ABX8R8J1_9CLOT|nr:TlpA disulfide reductase family protein [Crassaminicella indica]QXM05359.1 TlpA family protein disulfide reductase [Crassaminicella indica]
MKKPFKILLIILASIICLLAVAVIIGPADPIMLTEEEESQQYEEYNEKFSNLNISGFETKDLNSEKITSDIFKDYKITMVNIWGTFCSPCVEEMPDIGKAYKNLPKGSNIIGICVDAGDDEDTVEAAQKIMKKSNADFRVLIPDDVLKKQLLDFVTFFPTTIFVDEKGNIVGDVYNGGRSEEDYRKAIIEKLKMVENTK